MEILIPIALLVLLTWFVLIRPQRRRQAEQRDLLSQLEEGDEILTAGGVFGRVRHVGDEQLTVEIAPGTNIKLDKRAVAMIVSDESHARVEAHEEA